MSTTGKNQSPPLWFWGISGVGLLWNVLGVLAYLRQAYGAESLITGIFWSPQAFTEGTPSWVIAALAIAVWGGCLGCIALLFRKRWAISILLFSLLGILTHTFYTLVLSPAIGGIGSLGGFGRQLLMLIMGILPYSFARIARRRLWLH